MTHNTLVELGKDGLFEAPLPEQNRQANFALGKKSTGRSLTKVIYYEATDGNPASAVT